ncbi:MAG TPA: GNAT family N-acetyltransferase [Candidatus Saccharimonadales bacterium]|jgi:ribosomal protein S18 acetylase RimI-like enzyme|nr:GNAT family N-acetyltransferase [Candidatus Saccharimonadales bacterium]
MIIRNYQEADFADLVRLMDEFNDYIVSVDTSGVVKSYTSPADCETYTIQTIKDANERNGFIYVAEENGNIIGFVQGIIDNNDKDILYVLTHIPFADGWIGELYVKPEFRGQGIGKQLVAKANCYFKGKGCKYVRVYVLNDNVNTVNIYKKLGFKIRDLEMLSEL